MLANVDEIEPYMTRSLLLRFAEAVKSSPHLNETKKIIIDRLVQEIVDTWTSKNLV